MKELGKMVRGFFVDERGQGTVEWVLITALIVVAVMILIMLFGDEIKRLVEEATDWVSGQSVN